MGATLAGALQLMIVGMLGIFIALGVIYLATKALIKRFPADEDEA